MSEILYTSLDFPIKTASQRKFPTEARPKLFGTDNALDLTWMADFMHKMKSQDFVLDGFTWHAYPLGAGKDEIVDSKIMDPNFGEKVDSAAESLNKARAKN